MCGHRPARIGGCGTERRTALSFILSSLFSLSPPAAYCGALARPARPDPGSVLMCAVECCASLFTIVYTYSCTVHRVRFAFGASGSSCIQSVHCVPAQWHRSRCALCTYSCLRRDTRHGRGLRPAPRLRSRLSAPSPLARRAGHPAGLCYLHITPIAP